MPHDLGQTGKKRGKGKKERISEADFCRGKNVQSHSAPKTATPNHSSGPSRQRLKVCKKNGVTEKGGGGCLREVIRGGRAVDNLGRKGILFKGFGGELVTPRTKEGGER